MRLVAPILAILAALAAAAPAQARTGPCADPGGPTCRQWTAKVIAVNDGDTIDVRIAGTRRVERVRLTAVQAMELTHYNRKRRRGQCHAVAATLRLERLLRRAGNRVRLSALRASSRVSQGRLLRAVAVRSGGRWRDVGEVLIREGHALWLPNGQEPAWNARYNRAQQEAARRGANLWNPTRCGSGPQQDVPIEVWVRADPVGIDTTNVAGEWVRVRNHGTERLALGRWWVRDSMLRRFTFPRGTAVPAGGEATVHVGAGADAPGVFHWGLGVPIFENAQRDGRDLGDGAYLFDPQGDLRGAMLYPCVVACTDPRQGALALEAWPRGAEELRVTNVSERTIDLYGLQLALGGSSYAFGRESTLAPGTTMVVEVGGDPGDDTASRRHWGVDRPMLVDGGGSIRLSTFSGVVLACDAWGDAVCIE